MVRAFLPRRPSRLPGAFFVGAAVSRRCTSVLPPAAGTSGFCATLAFHGPADAIWHDHLSLDEAVAVRNALTARIDAMQGQARAAEAAAAVADGEELFGGRR